MLGRASRRDGWQNTMPHDFVHCRHLQMPFRASKCSFVWTIGETGEKTNGMANVKAAQYVGKEKFTKNVSTGETFL